MLSIYIYIYIYINKINIKPSGIKAQKQYE